MKPGDHVLYAGAAYEVADITPTHVGIYDEPPSKHIDYVKVSSVALIVGDPVTAPIAPLTEADADLGELDPAKACRLGDTSCPSCE